MNTQSDQNEKQENGTPEPAADPGNASDEQPVSANDGAAPEPAAEAAAEGEESPWMLDPVDRIAELEEELAGVKDQFLRFMAEAENVRKRSERQLAEAHKYGVANFARAVLTVADDLSRALAAVPEDQRNGDGLLQTLLGGVEAVERELVRAFEAHNIERIDPVGEPFDPNFHEAMYEVPDSEYPNGTVAQVVQPGYRLHDRLLRPARVGVAKGDGAAPQAHVDTTV
ncbi:MAG: nucleotide exchange factor GrpE [Alphaproteobacteria bacterium]|nr:nucleotide exchange factor GrpE [Alphaproteobacteria bacterium]